MRTAAWLAVGLLSVGVVVATGGWRLWRATRPAQQHLTDVDTYSLLRALGETPGLEVEVGTFVSGKVNHFVIEITNHGPFPRAVRLPVGCGGIVEDQGTLLLVQELSLVDGSPEVDQAPASTGFPADRVRMRRANIGNPKFLALDIVLTTRWSSLRATLPSPVLSKADALLRLETVLREALPTDQHACWRRAPLEVSWSWEGGELVASSAPDLPWAEARASTDKVDFHVHGEVVDVLLGNLPIFPEVPWPPGPAPDAWFRSDTAYAEEVQESLNEIFMCSLDFRSLSAH